jgi:enoyl-CoA hydratase/carnithine racemase
MASSAFDTHRLLELSDTETDAAFHSRLRKMLRTSSDHSCVVLTGAFAAQVDDMAAFGDWIRLLADIPAPLLLLVTGPIGPRGIAVILMADQIVLGTDAVMADRWQDAPGLAALAHRRLGRHGASMLLFGPAQNPLAVMTGMGVAHRADDPEELLRRIVSGLGPPARSHRHKRVLRAASELPFSEALAFDLWFDRDLFDRDLGDKHP